MQVLADLVHRIATAGRLRIPELRAVQLLHAAGSGTILALLAVPEPERDPALSETAREAVIAAITAKKPVLTTSTPTAAAIALRAVLPDATSLTTAERHLLDEWLARLASAG
jgi:hypothetical protein